MTIDSMNNGVGIDMIEQSGTVTGYDNARGYGWVRPDSGDRPLRVFKEALEASNLFTLTTGQRVRYQVEWGYMGELMVSQLVILTESPQKVD